MISKPSLHSRSNPQGMVNPPEVVEHEMQGYGMAQVLDLFAEGIGEPRKAAHAHPHGQVLALDVGRGNRPLGRVADDLGSLDTAAFRRAVPRRAFALAGVAVELDQHAVVDVLTESIGDRDEIGTKAVSRKLNAISEAAAKILHEPARSMLIVAVNAIANHQLGIGINRGPGPNITNPERHTVPFTTVSKYR